jgi:hypothetical protein
MKLVVIIIHINVTEWKHLCVLGNAVRQARQLISHTASINSTVHAKDFEKA